MMKRAIINTQNGFTLPELMIVIAIIVILAAFTLPSLLGTKQAAREKVVKSKLAAIAAAETTYRTLLKKGRYGTLDELQTTISGGSPLVTVTDLTVPGWTISEIDGSTSQDSFGLKAVPAGDNPRPVVYVMFEDQVLRQCPIKGTLYTRSCPAITE